SFCSKHGGVWTSNPSGALELTVKDPAKVSKYRFGTETAEFQICSSCGIVPVVLSEIAGRLYAVVSAGSRLHRRDGLIDIAYDFHSGGRHEMLKEINRDEVHTRRLAWIASKVDGKSRSCAVV